MLNNLGLGFVFTARDLASETINKLGRSFEQFERKASQTLTRTQTALRQFAIGAGIAMAGFFGVAASLRLADASGEFTQEMAKVAALSDIAADSAEGLMLRTTALDASMRTKFAPAEAAKGLQEFAAQGFAAKEQASALVPALRLAQAGQIGVAESAEAMTAALKVFSIDASQAGVVTDKLLKIANVTSLGAKDLSLSLGTVARGATLTGQSLDEMLISVGLVKNTGVDASVAASSVSSALMFMAKNADEFSKIGVKVTNANGSFRNFIDVVMETNAELSRRFPNAAERAAKASELFERFGVTAFQAVSNQINNGIRDSAGNLMQGAAAVDFLRKSMENAAGTAEKFEETLLNTFAGQKQLLAGSLRALAVVVGAPFEAAFKPIVAGIRDGIMAVIEFVQSIPKPVLEVFAQFAIGASLLLGALGSLVALKGGLMLISSAMGFMGISFNAALGPIVAVGAALGAVGLVVAAFRSEAKQSTNSTVGFFQRGFEKIKLFFEGLVQYFKDGALSGPILDELNKTENAGVKSFLGSVLDFGARMIAFFEGVGRGFDAFISMSAPAFEALREALTDLGDSLGFITGDFEQAAEGSMNKFHESGVSLGKTLGQLAVLMIQALTIGIKLVDSFMEILDSLGLTIGDVVSIWFKYKIVMLAINVATKAYVLWTTAGATATKLFGAASAFATGKMSAMSGAVAGANTKLTAMMGSTAGKLGVLGLIATVGILAYELGTVIDQFFGISDATADWLGKVTGLNAELERLNELNGGVTDKRGAQETGTAEHIAGIAAQRGMSLEQYQAFRIQELQEEGWDAYVAPDGQIKIAGKMGEVHSKEQYAVAAREAVGASAGAQPEPLFPVPAPSDAAMTGEMQKHFEELQQVMERDKKIELSLYLDGEQIQAHAERVGRAAKSRAFSPVPVEG